MRKIIKAALPITLVIASAAVVWTMTQAARSERPDRKPEAASTLVVEVMPVRVTSQSMMVASQGSVEPRTQTTLVAEVSGKVVSVSPTFNAGGFFRKGEMVLQIDPSDYLTAQKRAQANLASRQAQLADQQARADQALRDWQNLGRSGEPSDLVLRKPQLAEANANVLAAEADLQKAERDLERTRIRIPYHGIVREKKVDLGQFVAPGTALGVTYAVGTAEIRLPLSSSEASFLDLPVAVTSTPGEGNTPFPPVRLFADSGGAEQSWEGVIIRTEGVLDDKSRVMYAVAEIQDPYGVLGTDRPVPLRFGTFVRAEIEGRRMENIVVLPRKVLTTDETILVANAEGELEVRDVDVLRKDARSVYVGGGLESGDLVITTSIDAPIPGMKLLINNPTASNSAPAQVVSGAAIPSADFQP